ncbi:MULTISPECIES: phospho-sugar mutase [Streptomyces]|uniref:Phospho-sugar mutase n=1 Tax=Streptomyces tsukubensis (strain DSM 42081 / NBRC 108919 / NRRL 18488 / 9993) TaxID=1114943 RepID=I2N4Z5_STRT9|nr:phospho-sugar mutase [Streptomyces tsukubensis]MYS65316.1 phospho-sugar mutase [Streptomyces sp. SID5473]AZK96123.1 phosphomannomutase [Streptomyces tsukubensis]EIF92092.1 phosphomannomutase [Streptomyces tsukubensis NRRL18488]QKM67861.1 phospho-sugar mutase [Streptomyces tsukubensis NRRL18488]TAI44254.1 phospho-sugar mutase [Streptomyces tsukubensis]
MQQDLDRDLEDLIGRAESWLAEDPDPDTREELAKLLDGVREGGDPAALAARFSGTLQFGTAGLRGELGAGPMRMNRAVVIRAAAGLAAYLKAEGQGDGLVVVGYDARYKSADFARDTAAVMVGAGLRAAVLPRPLPTPVLAFAIRQLGAVAGVEVTASHNPPRDNGYKVYLGDGSQIVPPADSGIAAEIDAVASLHDVPLAGSGWEILGDEVLAAYLERTDAVLTPGSPRTARTVYTAMHGVGRPVLEAAFARAGFPAPVPVAEQADPDPAFPTVAFPNPEEPGAMDLSFAAARRERPDLVIANDPDADRCAVAVPHEGDWRMLRGDEVGALLAAHLVRSGARGTFAESIVSSSLLGRIAEAAGLPYEETLTGFKWIARVDGLRYGYEEALGYCVDPEGVRDKDGITAALLITELASVLKEEGRTLTDLLDDLAVEHGLHATDQLSVRVEDLGVIADAMARLRTAPPAELAGLAVTRAEDLAEGSEALPPTDGLRYHLDGAYRARVIVRPSGTEPKLKCYLEVVVPVGDHAGLETARVRAAEVLAALKADFATAAGI